MRQGSLCGMLRASSNGCMSREGEGVVVRRGHLIAVVVTFLIGCAVLLLGVGCSGTRTILVKSWTKKGQALVPYITNDVPGFPKGGLLTGTNKLDHLAGKDGP